MSVREVLKILGIVIVLIVFGWIVYKYWEQTTYIHSYDECIGEYGVKEIRPGIHRCKVPFTDREYFFDECSVEEC
jgi:hypothetical protein